MRAPRYFAIWTLVVLLGACAPSATSRLFSASIEGGIGGTGMEFWQGGIGGTGVVGTITGFGSIVVNGMHIAYDPKMALNTIIEGQTATRLSVGQLVAVEARRVGGRLTARAIEVRYQVGGPIEAIDARASQLRIMGQIVHLAPRVRFGPKMGARPGGIADLRVGENVVISGLRHGTVIEAGYVAHAPRADFAALLGPVSGIAKNAVTVNGRRVLVGSSAARLKKGDIVRIVGRLAGGVMRARRIDVQPKIPFGGRVTRLSLEGYVNRQGAPGAPSIDNVPLDSSALRGARLQNGKRVIVFGVVGEGGAGDFKVLRSFDPKTFDGARGAPTPQAAVKAKQERSPQNTRRKSVLGGASKWGGRNSSGGASSDGGRLGGGSGGSRGSGGSGGGHSGGMP